MLLDIRLGIAEHHGQSVIGLTEVASHLPIQYTIREQEEQHQLETQADGEVYNQNPQEWIYKVSHNEHERELETVFVKGRLKTHIAFSRNIGAPDFVISVIQEGYKIPFIEEPPVAYLRNNQSVLRHKEFVQQAISELLQSNRIVESITTPHVVNPLSVSVHHPEN